MLLVEIEIADGRLDEAYAIFRNILPEAVASADQTSLVDAMSVAGSLPRCQGSSRRARCLREPQGRIVNRWDLPIRRSTRSSIVSDGRMSARRLGMRRRRVRSERRRAYH